jgi:hypothetical protein
LFSDQILELGNQPMETIVLDFLMPEGAGISLLAPSTDFKRPGSLGKVVQWPEEVRFPWEALVELPSLVLECEECFRNTLPLSFADMVIRRKGALELKEISRNEVMNFKLWSIRQPLTRTKTPECFKQQGELDARGCAREGSPFLSVPHPCREQKWVDLRVRASVAMLLGLVGGQDLVEPCAHPSECLGILAIRVEDDESGIGGLRFPLQIGSGVG